MANFTAADMVGLRIYAKSRIPKLRWGDQDAEIVGYVEPGQLIGVVSSWLSQKPGKDFWFWEFDDLSRGQFSTFYVAHIPETLMMDQLREDFQERDEATRRRRLEWYQRAIEDGSQALAAGGNQLITGAFVLGGIYLIGQLLKR